jgi:hypothetical protein
VLLAGCGGSQPPIAAPGAMPQSSAIATHADRGTWMLPAAKSAKRLLYVSDEATNGIFVYDYPSLKAVGELAEVNDPGEMCVDAKGDVYVTSFINGTVAEYAHGDTALLNTYKPGGEPEGCSVDAQGDLAVSSFYSAEFVVFPKGDSSDGKGYKVPSYCTVFWNGGYDNHRNLYAGGDGSAHCEAFELPADSQSIRAVSIKPYLGTSTISFMWDGEHLTFTKRAKREAMYQVEEVAPSGNLNVVAETHLFDRCYKKRSQRNAVRRRQEKHAD